MSTPSSGPGGVKNLRALFEIKNGERPESPPSRGRSDSDSQPRSRSRPVSRVRATFVPVEKAEPPVPKIEQKYMMENANGKVNGVRNTSEEFGAGGLGVILKGSAFEPNSPRKNVVLSQETKHVTPLLLPQEDPTVKPAEIKEETEKKSSRAVKEPVKPIKTSAAPVTKAKTVKSPTVPSSAPNTSSQSNVRSPVLNKKSPTLSSSPSIPAYQRAKGGVAKIAGILESSKRAQAGRDAAAKAETEAAEGKAESSESNVPSTAAVAASKPKTNGIMKENVSPKIDTPSSPGRPIKLPAAATAATAASTARAESNAHHTEVEPVKKPTKPRISNVSGRVPRAAAATTASSLAKKASSASLGVSQHENRPKSRVSTAGRTDDGFLARMTRPTASSSQKTHEKVKVDSPPRARPATATTAGSVRSRQAPASTTNSTDVASISTTQKPKRTMGRTSLKGSSGLEVNGEDKENTNVAPESPTTKKTTKLASKPTSHPKRQAQNPHKKAGGEDTQSYSLPLPTADAPQTPPSKLQLENMANHTTDHKEPEPTPTTVQQAGTVETTST